MGCRRGEDFMPVESVTPQMEHESFSREELQEQVHRISQSRVLLHSQTLQRLLQYLAVKSIEAPGAELKEYTIGVEALGRRPSFDPKDDTIVRVQIHRLRQKLEEYYAAEGIHDPILITIPKGCYLPTFEAQRTSAPPPAQITALPTNVLAGEAESMNAVDIAPALKLESRQSFRGWARAGIQTLLLAAICLLVGWTLGRRSDQATHSASPSAVAKLDTAKAFWTNFLGNDSTPIIAFADAVFLLDNSNDLFRYRQGAIDDRGAPVDPDLALRYASNPSLVGKAGKLYFDNGYTGTGDLKAVAAMVRFLTRMGVTPTVKSSRDLTTEDLKEHSVIVVGSPFQNIATAQLAPSSDLVFNNPDPRHEVWSGKILNLRPRPGESATYETERDPVTQIVKADYCLISIQPGIVPGRHIALLGGLDTTGNEGGALFATSPSGVEAILGSPALSARKGASDQLPLFQALLRVSLAKGSEVLSSSLVTVHLSSAKNKEAPTAP
jgi:hypothetical protein